MGTNMKNLFKPMFCEVNPESWEEAKFVGKILKQHSLYVFRGQGNKNWKLKTLMERAMEKYRGDSLDTGRWMYENQILEKFKTRAHQYIQSPPDNQEVIEWLSIIQHHGGPTRLLDFTESFYIAAYFAIESSLEDDSCIWAIDETSLSNFVFHKTGVDPIAQKSPQLPGEIGKVKKFAEMCVNDISMEENLALTIIPSRLNERLAVQRGIFLFPCNLGNTFEKNLCETFTFPFDTLEQKNATPISTKELEKEIWDRPLSIIKINLKNAWNREAIHDLYSMNIDSASLFPGLDGFAKSLNFILQDFESGG